ncbi:MAG: hypothetical protein ACT4QC_17750 [Planctomycetaceae bacterium]
MGPAEWIAALTAAGGFIGWMTALWVRAGRILQRIDDLVCDQEALKSRVERHELRLTRLEVAAERRQ